MSAVSPIVVLDSGLGGLTVVRALRQTMPGEDILYFGDTARLPYGSKTAGTVTSFVQQIIAYLRQHHPKHVVIACNTATALALPAVRATFPELSISGVVDPGAKAAIVAAGQIQAPVIGIIATEATIASQAYEKAIHRRRSHAKLLLRPAPLLVPIIEEGRTASDPLVRLALKQYIEPMIRHKMNVLVLGCTHYPVFRELIQKMTGSTVPVIDSARQCAEDVARRLRAAGLVRAGRITNSAETPGSLRCMVTDDPARFQRLAPRFLGIEIEKPFWVAPEELYAPVPPTRLSIPA